MKTVDFVLTDAETNNRELVGQAEVTHKADT
jgi:hypothetical protein